MEEIPNTKAQENKKSLDTLEERFRYSNDKWPDAIEWRGETFILHNISEDSASYDAPEGPHGGQVIVDKEGYVVGGHDKEFNKWNNL